MAVAKLVGIDENNFKKHVVKIHFIGRTENGNQARIIKFITHSYKEKIFQQFKWNQKIDNEKRMKHQTQVSGAAKRSAVIILFQNRSA